MGCNNTSDVMWEDSLLNTYLQSSSVLSNSNVIPSSWINEISSVKWNNGIFNSSWPQRNGETIYVFESEEVTSSTYKVGLMYLSDYFYANNKGGTKNCFNNECLSWLTDTSHYQWTMTRSGVNNNNNYSWVADSDGYTYYTLLTNTQVSRPTFYLEDNVKWIEGTGTSSDPYLIE